MTHRAITAAKAIIAVMSGDETAKAVAYRLGIKPRRARRILAILKRGAVFAEETE
jgi:hypothetical protein